MRFRRACVLLGLALLVAGVSGAAEHEGSPKPGDHDEGAAHQSAPAEQAAAEEEDAIDPADIPVFEPPGDGEPTTRVGGATRGSAPRIFALAPKQTGLTLAAQPVFYWYLSQPQPGPVEFVLGTSAGDYLVQDTLEGPWQPGVHAIDLSDYEASLELGTDYQWIVALPPAQGSGAFAGGGVRRVAPEPAAVAELEGSDEARRGFVYARHGLWYDALHALSQRIRTLPGDSKPHRQRAALLQQVGLATPARADLAAVGAAK